MIGDRDLSMPMQPPRRVGLIVGAVAAFLLGVGSTAYVTHRVPMVGEWLHPSPAPVITRVPVPVAAPGAPARSDPALVGRVSGLEQQINSISDRAQEARGDADRAEGLLVAFAARRAIERGQPLGFLEGMLRAHFGGTEPQAVAAVMMASQHPITLVQLQDGFTALAPRLVAASPGEGWWTGLRRELGSLFVLRHADQPSILPADRQAHAVHALDQGQVDVAADEVARMPGAKATAAVEWLNNARRYAQTRSALDRLETAALLAPPPAPPEAVKPEKEAAPTQSAPAAAPVQQAQ